MKDIELVLISVSDLEILDFTQYKTLSIEQKKALVNDSERGYHEGNFFRFYLVKNGEEIVGVLNMCGHGNNEISVAPEIIEGHRNKGFATKGLKQAYLEAKKFGFKVVVAGIRKENIASQRLHEKLGFNFKEEFVSKNGNSMKKYLKVL